MNKTKMILRTSLPERLCHWGMVVCFALASLSGLSWLFPSFKWLNQVLGTPQLARILHPFLGIVVFACLVYLFIRFVKYNLFEPQDKMWLSNLKSVASGNHEKPLHIGKYNAGQKLLFWGIMLLICVLLVTGLIGWRAYFSVAIFDWHIACSASVSLRSRRSADALDHWPRVFGFLGQRFDTRYGYWLCQP
jgi:formate dehydrogenase subunit gamma